MTDTIAADTTTTATINLIEGNHGSVSGRIDHVGDRDWYRVTLKAGTTYNFFSAIQIAGSPAGDGVLSLFDSNGVLISTNDDASGIDFNSFISFTVVTAGTYFLEVRDLGDNQTASYTLLATNFVATNEFLSFAANTQTAASGRRLVGSAGDDLLDAGANGFDLLGEQGNDTLTGNANVNLLAGGDGNDALVGNGNSDYLFGDAGDDYIDGGDQGDFIFGGDGFDVLIGGAGFDTLDGGADGDLMSGGTDDDTYVVDSVDDTVIENPAEGTDTVQSSISLVLAANVENLTLTGAGNINGTGNAAANIITGNGGNNILNGAGGADVLNGGLGNDTYVLGAETDTVNDTGGTDTITSTISRLLANFAGIENLTLVGAGAVNGTGTGGKNVIIGNQTANILDGGGGNDTIDGGGGKDKIIGGAGRDTMKGGADVDDFIFASVDETGKKSSTRDIITDFKHNTDNLDLHLIDANGSARGNGKFDLLKHEGDKFAHHRGELHYKFSGANTLVEGDTDGDGKADFQIQLTGHIKISAGDIIP